MVVIYMGGRPFSEGKGGGRLKGGTGRRGGKKRREGEDNVVRLGKN